MVAGWLNAQLVNATLALMQGRTADANATLQATCLPFNSSLQTLSPQEQQLVGQACALLTDVNEGLATGQVLLGIVQPSDWTAYQALFEDQIQLVQVRAASPFPLIYPSLALLCFAFPCAGHGGQLTSSNPSST
jgi:hypothetical protein